MAVFAPVQHIRALGQEDVTERCVAAVAWTGQHHEVAVNFSREENGISVEWKEWILHTYEGFKIFCFCHSDGCTVEVLAPDDVVGIFYFYKTRVICVNRHERFAFFVNELDFVLIEIPVDRIFASSKVDVRDSVCLLTTEYSDELVAVRHNGAVEDSCYFLHRISSDNRILAVSPYRCTGKLSRAFLPWHIFDSISNNFNFAHFLKPP